MEDVEAFSVSYRARLDEAELARSVPQNITLEVMMFSNHCYLFSVICSHDCSQREVPFRMGKPT